MTDQVEEEQIAEFKKAFAIFDQNGDGSITTQELVTVLRTLEQDPTEAEIQDMLNEIDSDGSGTIDFQEFLSLMAKKMKDINNEEELSEAFKAFNYDKIQLISAEKIRQTAQRVGQQITEQEIQEIMLEADIDGDGHINYNEFVRMMRK